MFIYPDRLIVSFSIQGGFQLFIATSKLRVFAKRIVEHFELPTFFVAVYGKELDGTQTDKAELIKNIVLMQKLGPLARSHQKVFIPTKA